MMIGQRLKELRTNAKISAAQLAREFQVTRQYIYFLERSNRIPPARMIEMYTGYFQVPADYIIGESGGIIYIPASRFSGEAMEDAGRIALPSSFLDEEFDHLALILDDEAEKEIVVLEKDPQIVFSREGLFEYDGNLYLSKLEKYKDGSVYLNADNQRKPREITELDDLSVIGYSKYKLVESDS